MSQHQYTNKQQIRKALEAGLSNLKNKTDFSTLKAFLSQEAQNIAPAITNPIADLKSMKTTLAVILASVDKESHDQVQFYNCLAQEYNDCAALAINAVPRFAPSGLANRNVTYICEFSEFLGYVNSHIDEFFH